jgi:hypothetical protein
MKRLLFSIVSIVGITFAIAYGIIAVAAGLASMGILLAINFDVDVGGGISWAEMGIRTVVGLVVLAIAIGAGLAAGILGTSTSSIGKERAQSLRHWIIVAVLPPTLVLVGIGLFFTFNSCSWETQQKEDTVVQSASSSPTFNDSSVLTSVNQVDHRQHQGRGCRFIAWWIRDVDERDG